MKHMTWMLAAVPVLIFAGVALAQYPIMDRVADKVVQKYQNATCQQLWQERAAGQGRPKPPEEQRAVEFLRQDPAMRAAFLNKVAAPIANKMFECGMIP
jgi:alpha-beta hydrolase superfamily lysophospholipase